MACAAQQWVQLVVLHVEGNIWSASTSKSHDGADGILCLARDAYGREGKILLDGHAEARHQWHKRQCLGVLKEVDPATRGLR